MRSRFSPDIPLTIGPKVVKPQPPQGLKPAGREHLYVDAAGRMSYAPPLPPTDGKSVIMTATEVLARTDEACRVKAEMLLKVGSKIRPDYWTIVDEPAEAAPAEMLLKVGDKIRTGALPPIENLRNREFTVARIEGVLFWVDGYLAPFSIPMPGKKHSRLGPDFWAIVEG